jgi:hypothetical protein
MNEITLQWAQAVKLITLVVFATLYGFGGVSGKWKRRFVAPFVLTAGIIGASLWTTNFHVWYALYFPLLSISLHVGYGGSGKSWGYKILKRFRAGLLAGLAALPIAWATGAWSVFGLHIVVTSITSIVLGTWNQTSSARAEETAIGASYGLLPLFMT